MQWITSLYDCCFLYESPANSRLFTQVTTMVSMGASTVFAVDVGAVGIFVEDQAMRILMSVLPG